MPLFTVWTYLIDCVVHNLFDLSDLALILWPCVGSLVPTSIVQPPSLAVFKVRCSVSLCQSPGVLPSHHHGPLQHLWPHSCLLLTSINTMISWAYWYATPSMVSQLGGGLCGFRHSAKVPNREVGILIMIFDKETSHRK